MANLLLIEGSAGTGKTSRIVADIGTTISDKLTHDFQKVLILCRMHGARRRVLGMLQEKQVSLKRVRIVTIDSFALTIVNRYRRYLELSNPVRSSGEPDGWSNDLFGTKIGFDSAAASAANLLKRGSVAKQVSMAYPVVVIDEFQDCTSSRLEIVRCLRQHSDVIAAADDFQCLNSEEREAPAITWARGVTVPERLIDLHRTKNEKILRTATILRTGHFEDGPLIDIFFDESGKGGLAAYEIAKRLSFRKWCGSSVILSNTLDTAFFRQIIGSLSHELGKKVKIGPYPFEVENFQAVNEKIEAAVSEIMDKNQFREINLIKLKEKGENSSSMIARETAKHVFRRATLSGIEAIPGPIIKETAARLEAHRMHFGIHSPRRLAMTIHTAKNREFDYVFILWPFKIAGSKLLQRKLLYNAVTRAKKDAVLIVQGTQEKRLKKDATLQLLFEINQ